METVHAITKRFEAALCEYTGAPFAVAVNSCTMAIFLVLKRLYLNETSKWKNILNKKEAEINLEPITIPKKTYIGVAQSVLHSGFKIEFEDINWEGCYMLDPLPVYDCARRFTSGMFNSIPGGGIKFQCVSFHASKILGDSQGGAILHNDPVADIWFRRARFDGRTEGVHPKYDDPTIGWHCYMSPDVAARLLWKLGNLPKHNADLPNDDYPDLGQMRIFKRG